MRLAAALAVLAAAASTATAAPSVLVPEAVRPGDLFVVRVAGDGPAPALALFGGLEFRPVGPREGPLFLLGTDLEAPPGGVDRVVVRFEGGAEASAPVRIAPRAFPEERLTLPREMVTPPKELLERIAREREAAAEVYRSSTPLPLWEGWFAPPVPAPADGNFGRRRILNGEPRSPHSGQDYKVPAGTTVRATAAGKVRLARDLYYSGLTVLLDHGAGLVSQYFHLEKLLVAEGETVAAGQAVGRSGSTGRVTGPHLHFGLRLHGLRVDPESLWGLGSRTAPSP